VYRDDELKSRSCAEWTEIARPLPSVPCPNTRTSKLSKPLKNPDLFIVDTPIQVDVFESYSLTSQIHLSFNRFSKDFRGILALGRYPSWRIPIYSGRESRRSRKINENPTLSVSNAIKKSVLGVSHIVLEKISYQECTACRFMLSQNHTLRPPSGHQP
jgi:hypothetical protein